MCNSWNVIICRALQFQCSIAFLMERFVICFHEMLLYLSYLSYTYEWYRHNMDMASILYLLIFKYTLQVRSTIKSKFSRWQEGRSVATRYTRGSIGTNADNINLTARGSLLSATSVQAMGNGRVQTQNQNSECATRNNNVNGFTQLSSPIIKDEQL